MEYEEVKERARRLLSFLTSENACQRMRPLAYNRLFYDSLQKEIHRLERTMETDNYMLQTGRQPEMVPVVEATPSALCAAEDVAQAEISYTSQYLLEVYIQEARHRFNLPESILDSPEPQRQFETGETSRLMEMAERRLLDRELILEQVRRQQESQEACSPREDRIFSTPWLNRLTGTVEKKKKPEEPEIDMERLRKISKQLHEAALYRAQMWAKSSEGDIEGEFKHWEKFKWTMREEELVPDVRECPMKTYGKLLGDIVRQRSWGALHSQCPLSNIHSSEHRTSRVVIHCYDESIHGVVEWDDRRVIKQQDGSWVTEYFDKPKAEQDSVLEYWEFEPDGPSNFVAGDSHL